MNIASSRFHQPGLAARLFLLVAFCFMGVTQANAAVAAGEWQSASDLSIVQGDRFYDRSLGAYYTYNTVTSTSGENLSGDLRLVVLSSSHSVLNADGIGDDGKPFFTVSAGGAEQVVKINFQRRRAAFSYSAQMQRFVEQADPDSDGDGVLDSVDLCANTPAGEVVDATGCSESQKDDDSDGVNNVVDQCSNTPSGETVDANGCSESQKDDDSDGVNNVVDQCSNTPTGEAVDVNGCSDSQKDDDNDGVTNAADSCPETPVGEAVDAMGCSESQKDDDNDGIVNAEDACPNDSTNTCFTINGTVRSGGTPLANAQVTVGINTVIGATDTNGVFSLNAGDPADIGFDGLDEFFPVNAVIGGFATGYAKVRIQPDVFEYELLIDLAPVSDIIGDDEDVTVGVAIDKEDEKVGELTIPVESFPAGVTAITGQITYLDPETDVDLAPGGDLLALPEGANPNDTPVPLETFGMMEFDLVDQDGNPVTDLAAPAEVCMKAGDGLAAGDTVPLWYYDDELGLWVEEGQGMVESRDGQLLICGEVNHFSWWNYDQPIETHSCFKYHFIDGNTGDSLREQFDWYAEGVTYSGTSPERLCDRDGDDPATPAPGDGDIDSLTVKRTTDDTAPEQIRVTTTIGGTKYYLVDDGDATYSLSSNENNAAVFNNPELNASCLNNTNVSDCLFLDYKEGVDANGILPLDVEGINFAPVISGLNSGVGSWGNLDVGSTTNVSVTVTDPEGGDVSVAWSAQCFGSVGNGSFGPLVDSGSSGSIFASVFTAPAEVDYFYSNCELILTATDPEGSIAKASQWVNIIDPDFELVVTGTLYGPDGLSMGDQLVRFPDGGLCNGLEELTTDSEGRYSINLGSVCEGGDEAYDGGVDVSFRYGGVEWVYESFIDPFICGVYEGEFGLELGAGEACEIDLHLPTVWATVTGAIVSSVNESFIEVESLDNGDFNNDMLGSFTVPAGQTSYGPVLFPVSSSGWLRLNGGLGREYQLPSTEPAILDIGSTTGSALITVYNRDNPQAGPLADVTVQVFTNNGTTANGTTDVNGQFIAAGLPLGGVWVSVSGLTTGFGTGFIDQSGQELVIDVNSSDTCAITGSTFDPFGFASGLIDLFYWNSTAGQSDFVTSGANGSFTLLNGLAGFGLISSDFEDDFFGDIYFAIDNCRPVNGLPREFRVDVPVFFGLWP